MQKTYVAAPEGAIMKLTEELEKLANTFDAEAKKFEVTCGDSEVEGAYYWCASQLRALLAAQPTAEGTQLVGALTPVGEAIEQCARYVEARAAQWAGAEDANSSASSIDIKAELLNEAATLRAMLLPSAPASLSEERVREARWKVGDKVCFANAPNLPAQTIESVEQGKYYFRLKGCAALFSENSLADPPIEAATEALR